MILCAVQDTCLANWRTGDSSGHKINPPSLLQYIEFRVKVAEEAPEIAIIYITAQKRNKSLYSSSTVLCVCPKCCGL